MNQTQTDTIFRFGALCAVLCLVLTPLVAHADDWPQWRGPDRDGVWHETDVIESFSGPELVPEWRVEVANGYSGPTVAKGRVYLTDRITDPVQSERVLCFNAVNGERLWTYTYECAYNRVGYPDGPRASVTIDDGRAYSFGAMGHVRCLDAVTGELIWKKDPDVDYEIEKPVWGMTAAPIVEGDLMIIQLGAKPDACIVAWDKRTGEEKWRALEDNASYSAPIVIEQAGKRVLVCWTGDNVVGLNPTTGDEYWKYETPAAKVIINVPTPVVDNNRMFLSSFYDGSYMLRLGEDTLGIEKIWRRQGANEKRTDALHCMIGTALIQGDYIYGVDSYGQLRCLDAATGDRVWEDLTAVPGSRWATIHMVRNGDKIWMFNERGELIISTLSPKGFHEISRARLIEPTTGQLPQRGGVTWSHPAFANRHVFIRNDTQLVSVNLGIE